MVENYVLLETISLTQTATSVVFDNIPQTGYTDLKLVASARTNRVGFNVDGLELRFNGSTTGDSTVFLQADPGSGVTSQTFSTFLAAGWTTNTDDTADTFGLAEAYIANYAGNQFKTVSGSTAIENFAVQGIEYISAGLWQNTAAITSITLLSSTGNTFQVGSTFSIYGIAALNTTPIVAPKAEGGDIVANDGTYWYHAFTTSGYFVPQTTLSCDVLQIAGGGGGGSRSGGGGGAGGISYLTSQVFPAASQVVAVGAGGVGGSRSTAGTNGTNSRVAALTAAVGGGFGGSAVISTGGASGGSGGGAANNGTGSAGTAGQGFAGGNSNNTSFDAAGGGGAGAVGANASTVSIGSGAGNGGAGVNTYSSWASVTNTGVSGFFAGGGGGGSFGSSNHGIGGSGGGGNGANTAPTNGIANTGGGAGGCGNSANTDGSPVGANGGSGIVIVRYLIV